MQREEKLKLTTTRMFVKFGIDRFLHRRCDWTAFFIIATIAMVVKVVFNY